MTGNRITNTRVGGARVPRYSRVMVSHFFVDETEEEEEVDSLLKKRSSEKRK